MSRVRNEEEEFEWAETRQPAETAAAKARRGARALIAQWTQATRARQRAEAALRKHELSFSLWWVLYTTSELIRENSDAVSQRAVCLRTGLDKATMSYLMGVLETRALIDRGPEFGGASYRIWLTNLGEDKLAQASAAIESAARAGAWSDPASSSR